MNIIREWVQYSSVASFALFCMFCGAAIGGFVGLLIGWAVKP